MTDAEAVVPDAQRVYCLTDDNRDSFLNAVEILEVAELSNIPARPMLLEGTAVSIERWAESAAAEFRRACSSLIESAQLDNPASPSAGGQDIWSYFPPAALAAVLTLAGTAWMGARKRARDTSAQLREMASSYEFAVEQYLASIRPGGRRQTPDEMRRTRLQLISALEACRNQFKAVPTGLDSTIRSLQGCDEERIESVWKDQEPLSQKERVTALCFKYREQFDNVTAAIEPWNFARLRPGSRTRLT